MNIFKALTTEEQAEFRRWARDNYTPLTTIEGHWHPEIQFECALINSSYRQQQKTDEQRN